MRAAAWIMGVAMAAAGDAGALSRAMWAEFNAIYYVNLRPTAECGAYRTRSLDLLKDNSLSPEALDARMRALWDEAKNGCLQTSLPGRPAARPKDAAAAKGTTPAVVAAAVAPTPSVAPPAAAAAPKASPPTTAASPAPPAAALSPPKPESTPAAKAPVAGGDMPGSPGTVPAPRSGEGASGSAPAPSAAAPMPAAAPSGTGTPQASGKAAAALAEHGPGLEARAGALAPLVAIAPPNIVPTLVRPPIALPSPIDLRLEAACAKRNPYAYQVQAGDDPCAKFARGKTPQDTAAEGAADTGGTSRVAVGVALAVAVLAAAGGGWVIWRRRGRRGDATHEDGDHADDALPMHAPA